MGQAEFVPCSNCSWSSCSLTYNGQPRTLQDSLAHISTTRSLLRLHQHHFRVLKTLVDSFLSWQECYLESQLECMWLKLFCAKVLTVLPLWFIRVHNYRPRWAGRKCFHDRSRLYAKLIAIPWLSSLRPAALWGSAPPTSCEADSTQNSTHTKSVITFPGLHCGIA